MLESSVYNRKRIPNWNVKNEIIHTIFSEDDDIFSSRWVGRRKILKHLEGYKEEGFCLMEATSHGHQESSFSMEKLSICHIEI